MIITDQKSLDSFCQPLKKAPFITVDTEFLREKTYYSKLCLIQIAGPDGNAVAIDPLEGGLDLAPVYELLFAPEILKVFHAGRQDLEIFFQLTGKVVTPFFDTQIAAMVCGYGDSVGYENLVRNITGNGLDKSVQFTDWSKRPLSKKQIEYALNDVIFLIKIYHHLSKELEKRGRISWVFEEEEILASPATYQNDPDNAWKRIKLRSPKPKMLAVLRDLAAWREKRAQDRNVPRTWILRDETLADMAAQSPRTPEQLKKIRGMPADLVNGHIGEALLDLIGKALESDKSAWPKVERKEQLPRHAAATVDILKMLLKVQCTEHDVASKLVASSEDLEAIAMEDAPEIPAMKGWRYEVFGADALALKRGELAIGLKDTKIMKYKTAGDSELYE